MQFHEARLLRHGLLYPRDRCLHFVASRLLHGATWVEVKPTWLRGKHARVRVKVTWVGPKPGRIGHEALWVRDKPTRLQGGARRVRIKPTRIRHEVAWVRVKPTRLYPFYYYEMSRAGVYGYLGFDAPYLLDAELTDSELARSLNYRLMTPSDLAAIRYALAVRYARREKYAEAAQIYDQLSGSRAQLMRRAAELYAATKAPGAPRDRQLEASYDYAEFLSGNEDGIFFNGTLWQGFQNGVLSYAVSLSDDAGRAAQMERQLRDDQEEYWRAYQILNRIVTQAGPTPLGKKAAARAIFCLRKIRTDRFGRSEEINRADLRLSSWLERNVKSDK